MNKPCLSCGDLSPESYCLDHTPVEAPRTGRDTTGRDYRWQKLSKRARALQPFCSDCGTRSDLTADHSPQSWYFLLVLKKPIPIESLDVLCRPCNSRRGAAQPGSKRYEEWAHTYADVIHNHVKTDVSEAQNISHMTYSRGDSGTKIPSSAGSLEGSPNTLTPGQPHIQSDA